MHSSNASHQPNGPGASDVAFARIVKVSTAARTIKRDTGFVYRAIQFGKIRGVLIDGIQFVDGDSLAAFAAKELAEPATR